MAHRPRKRFGQNFLHDTNILQRMILAIAPQAEDQLVEIGPGKGALTQLLLKQAGHLTAIELDRDLIDYLKEKMLPYGELRLIQADALTIDLGHVINNQDKIRIVGNLPYNISTPILFHLADHAQSIRDAHVLLQKEVAARITAQPGNKQYGKLSVMMQYYFSCVPLFDVPPGAFRPAPKVNSSFIRLLPHHKPAVTVENIQTLQEVVGAAFNQRRKTLRNSLQSLFSTEQLRQAGIDASRRAETLSLEEFAALADMLESYRNNSTY